MDYKQKGSVSGLVVAAISVATLVAAFTGLVINNATFNDATEARVNSTGVMLEEGSLNIERIDDRTFEIEGNICFSTHPRTGGREDWTIWVTDNRGKNLEDGRTSAHVDGGRLYVSPGGDFPAECEYTNRDTGEGVLIDRNRKQPRRFSVIMTSNRNLSSSYCPDVYLQYRGTWFSGTPFAKVSLEDYGVCGPGGGGTPTTAPTPPTGGSPTIAPPTGGPTPTTAPTDIPTTPTSIPTAVPTAEPTIAPDSIEGYVSVYSCVEPERAAVEYCTGETCLASEGESTALRTLNPGDPEPRQGIWLVDNNDDRTWVYKYRITQDELNNPLDPGQTYFLPRALGFIGGTHYDSEREAADNLRVQPGQRRDFEVYADRTCGCSFASTANVWVRDTSGNLVNTTELDNQPGVFGAANNRQRFDRGDEPRVGPSVFRGGQIVVPETELGDFRGVETWGRDMLANIKLYAPGWEVVGQRCESTGESPACPGYTESWPAGSPESALSGARDPRVIEGIRVACGVDVDYGWVIEKIPATPTPIPPTAAPTPPIGGGDGIGRVEIHTFVFVDDDKEEPDSCVIEDLLRTSSRDGINKYSDDCKLELRDLAGNTLRKDEVDNCTVYAFENVPAGRYTVKVDTANQLVDFCKAERVFDIVDGQTTRVPYVKGFSSAVCKYQHATETTCSNCRDVGGSCMGRINNSGTQLCCVSGSDGNRGGSGGGGEEGCSLDAGLLCTGTGHGLGSAYDHDPDANIGNRMCAWKNANDPQQIGGYVGWCTPDATDACCTVIEPGGGSDPGTPGDPGTQPPPGSSNPNPPAPGGSTLVCDPHFYYDGGQCSRWTDATGETAPGCSTSQCYQVDGFEDIYTCCRPRSTNPGAPDPDDPIGWCANSSREYGTPEDSFKPFSTRTSAQSFCNREFTENQNPRVVRSLRGPEGRQYGEGFCCKIDSPNQPNPGNDRDHGGLGWCNGNNEHGTTTDKFKPFDNRSSAQTYCNTLRDSSIISKEVKPAKIGAEGRQTGTGFCCVVTTGDQLPASCNQNGFQNYNACFVEHRNSSGVCKEFGDKTHYCSNKNVGSFKAEYKYTADVPSGMGWGLEVIPVLCLNGTSECIEGKAAKSSALIGLERSVEDSLTLDPDKNRGYSFGCKIKSKSAGLITHHDCECTKQLFNTGFDRNSTLNIEYDFQITFTGRLKVGGSVGGRDITAANIRCDKGGDNIETMSLADTFSNADIDGNGIVNTLDMQYVMDGYGLSSADATIQSGDATTQSLEINPDANGDGIVNALDLSAVMSAFGQTANEDTGESELTQ